MHSMAFVLGLSRVPEPWQLGGVPSAGQSTPGLAEEAWASAFILP